MHDSHSTERLRKELRRQGLPGKYIHRVLREIGDHRIDLVEAAADGTADAQTTADAQLGDPRPLAVFVARQYRASRFSGRHPILALVVGPVLGLFLAWAAYFALFGLVLTSLRATIGEHTTATYWIAHLVHRGGLFIPSAVVAAAFCALALRSGRGTTWACGACLAVALLAAVFSSFLWFGLDEGTSRFGFQFGVSYSQLLGAHLLQFLVPVLVGALVIMQSYHRELQTA